MGVGGGGGGGGGGEPRLMLMVPADGCEADRSVSVRQRELVFYVPVLEFVQKLCTVNMQ